MVDLTPGMRALTPFARIIEGAAAARLGTAAIWQAVRDNALSQGITLAGATAADMSRMRGIAGQLVRASAVFAALPDDGVIPPEAVGTPFYARPATERAIAPAYEINYQVYSDTPGGQVTEWRTLMLRGALPTTRAEILDMVTATAVEQAGAGGPYEGIELAGIGQVRVLAV